MREQNTRVAAVVGQRLQLTVPLLGGVDAELGVFDPQAQTIPETTDYAEARERRLGLEMAGAQWKMEWGEWLTLRGQGE